MKAINFGFRVLRVKLNNLFFITPLYLCVSVQDLDHERLRGRYMLFSMNYKKKNTCVITEKYASIAMSITLGIKGPLHTKFYISAPQLICKNGLH